MTPEEERHYVLGNLLEGLSLLEACDAFAALIPEIRSNLVMGLAAASEPGEVAGIPGRITEVLGRPRAAGRPAFGGSRFTAAILLAVRRELPDLRAALEIRYRPELVAVLERMGLEPRSLEPVLAGTKDRAEALASLGRVFRECYSEPERLSVAYTEGGHAREGAIILVGPTAVDLAKRAVAIAEAYAGTSA